MEEGIRTTCHEMVCDRYPDVREEDLMDDDDSVVLDSRCVCVWIPSVKVGVNDVRACVARWPDTDTLVIITEGGATHFVGRKITDRDAICTEAEGHDIQVFTCPSLRFNVTKHALVPRHRLVSHDEISSICTAYGFASMNVLPTIKLNDPVVAYLNLRPGDVVEITRHEIAENGLAMVSRVYRQVRK